MSHGIKTGSTNPILFFRAYNTDNTAKVDLTSATTGLAMNAFRVGGSDVAISSLTDKSNPDDAHSDGAIFQYGSSNLYSVDGPDAITATQYASVGIEGSFTGGFLDGIPHPLTGYDATDAVRIGMTALPNAAADAAGGIPVSDAGGLDLDTILDNMYALQVTGISAAVEAAAGKHSVAGTVMMSTNAALSGGTLTAKKVSDNSTFQTYTVATSSSAENITEIS
jgi:hypothetical protein